MTNEPKIHEFDNGVKIYDRHLLDLQRKRYETKNIHEPEEEVIFKKIVKDLRRFEAYYDVGAAVGYYPILARMIRPEDIIIRAFEPLPSQMEKMRENFALNQLQEDDVALHSEAISNTEGTALLIDQSYGSFIAESQTPPNRPSVNVKTIPLDLFAQKTNETIGLLQIDVQGHEIKVLKGATNCFWEKRIRHVLVGTHGPAIHELCLQFLVTRGYSIEFEDFETAEQPDGIIHAKF
jgi:FkbM family methyltransferase